MTAADSSKIRAVVPADHRSDQRADKRWAIVGGGLLGMRLAEGLAENGANVTLFEAASHLGGLADAWSVGDVTWDRHYHVTLYSDLRLRALLERLELHDELEWGQTKTGFFVDGNFHSMSTSLEFLRFPPLNLWQKCRLAMTILRASKIRDADALHQMPIGDWLRRWSGSTVSRRIWEPLLRSKLGDQFSEASAAFIWATIQRMYAARRSGLKVERFGFVRGGYSRVLQAYQRRIETLGVEVRCGARIERIERAEEGLSLATHGGSQEFDRVICTLPPPITARICPNLDEQERHRLEQTSYLGIVCTSLVLKRPLRGYYVTNITDSGYPFTGVIEMTSLVSPDDFGGRHLVYLPRYLPADSELFGREDDEIFADVFAGLQRMVPDLTRDDVEAYRVSRVRQVFPFPSVGYPECVVGPATSVENLSLVNSSQIVAGTLNVNETIDLAERFLSQLEDTGEGQASQRELQLVTH